MNLYLSDKPWTEESTTICGVTFGYDFTTSAGVVMKACGLRLKAIRVEAREEGVEMDDPVCSNIDLSLLAALTDALRHTIL